MQFRGKVAWVLGAGGGIGREIAIRLSSEGAKVILFGRTTATLEETRRLCKKKAVVEKIDVVERMPYSFETLWEMYPAPQLAVACQAAPVLNEPVVEMASCDWRYVIDTDLTGTFLFVRAALSSMIPKDFGRIVCMSSIHAHKSTPNRAAYAAAKAGVEGFVRAVATEVGPYGITINAVAPGFTATARTLRAVEGNATAMAAIARTPTEKMAEVSEIADVVLFLLGNGAINGAVINADGGLSVAL